MKLLKQLLSNYWRICLLKESPENSPYSTELLCFTLFLFTLVLTLQWRLSEYNFSSNLIQSLVVSLSFALSFILYTAALLFFKKLKSRIVQTINCLLFVYSIIHIVALPLFLIEPYLTPDNLKNLFFLFIGVLYLFITLGLSIWQFMVTIHIYKFALNLSPIQSVLAAFGLVAVNVLTLSFWR